MGDTVNSGMPTVTIDISNCAVTAKDAEQCIDELSTVFARAAGAPREHVHITLQKQEMMTWGSQLAHRTGNHTAQVRCTVSQALSLEAKKSNSQRCVCATGEVECSTRSDADHFPECRD